MSQLLINDYLSQLDLIKKISGSQRETIVREAFKDLLKAWEAARPGLPGRISAQDRHQDQHQRRRRIAA